MQLKVDEINNKAVVEFGHDDFVISKCDDEMLGDYMLSHRIYLDYKDSVQEGMPFMYLSKEEADRLSKILDTFY